MKSLSLAQLLAVELGVRIISKIDNSNRRHTARA